MRHQLRRYNEFLFRTFVDIPTVETDYMERVSTTGASTGQVVRLPTASSRVFVRRIFSRGSWEKNGRFYGGWWQQVSKDLRKQIFINDQPTAEVDFKAMHVSILSLENGVTLTADPYTPPLGLVPDTDEALQRAIVKQLVLTAINARDRKSAFSAFRDGWPAGHFGKGMTNGELTELLNVFIETHPHLADSLCSDQGIRLMYIDSCIAARVISIFTNRNIPVLCVHDSFIVPYQHVGWLKQVLADLSTALVGHPLPVVPTNSGLDEMEYWPPHVRLDHINWRQTERCEGYLQRLAAHDAWLETLSPR